MNRWVIQLAIFAVFVIAAFYAIRVYNKNQIMKIIFPFLVIWVTHSLIFGIVVVARIVYYWGDAPLDIWMTLWANILQLHGGIAAVFTFISLSGGGNAIPPE